MPRLLRLVLHNLHHQRWVHALRLAAVLQLPPGFSQVRGADIGVALALAVGSFTRLQIASLAVSFPITLQLLRACISRWLLCSIAPVALVKLTVLRRIWCSSMFRKLKDGSFFDVFVVQALA